MPLGLGDRLTGEPDPDRLVPSAKGRAIGAGIFRAAGGGPMGPGPGIGTDIRRPLGPGPPWAMFSGVGVGGPMGVSGVPGTFEGGAIGPGGGPGPGATIPRGNGGSWPKGGRGPAGAKLRGMPEGAPKGPGEGSEGSDWLIGNEPNAGGGVNGILGDIADPEGTTPTGE
jgi:hypothetical protein